MKLSKIIIDVLIVVVALVNQGCFDRKKSFENDVRFETLKKKDMIQRVTMAGNVEPERKIIVTAPFNGYVKKIFVKVGQKIKKNEPIVSVVQSLHSSDPVYPLRAPFDGTVVTIQTQEGEFVKGNDYSNFILRIDSLKKLYVVSYVPEIDMVKIKKGQDVVIKVSAILDKEYNGVLEEISMASRYQEGWKGSKVEYPAKIRIVDPDQDIKPGMSVILDIVTLKKKSVLALPHEYLLKEDSQFYVIFKDGVRKKVEVGMQNEYFFEIISGISEGDMVKQINFLELL